MSVTCPCCGNPCEPTDLIVDSQFHYALANGELVNLSPAMAVILDCLNRRAPLPVLVPALMDAVWGTREEPDSADNMISVHIHRIRKLISKLGYDIETLRGSYRLNDRAYRLVNKGMVQ